MQVPCDGKFYMTLNSEQSDSTALISIAFDGDSVSFNKITEYATNIAAISYDIESGNILALSSHTGTVLKLGTNGVADTFGFDPSVDRWRSVGSDCTPDGLIIVQNRRTFVISMYSVIDSFRLIDTVTPWWETDSGLSGTVLVSMNDMAVDPKEPDFFYTHQRNYFISVAPDEPVETRGYLLKVNCNPSHPEFGRTTAVGLIDSNVVNHIGALFFDQEGVLHGYGSLQRPEQVQKYLVRIDKRTANAEVVGIGPVTGGADGCSCPYSIDLRLGVAAIEPHCDAQYVTLEAEIVNNTLKPLNELVFTDTLPSGLKFTPSAFHTSVGYDLHFNHDSTVLTATGISIAINESFQFRLYVEAPNSSEVYTNRASVINVPSLYGNSILSDDPSTSAYDDLTVIPISEFNQEIPGFVTMTICETDSITLEGHTFSSEGTHIIPLPGQAARGCDSIIYLDLHVDEEIELYKNATICEGDTYNIHFASLAEPGFFEFHIPSENSSCDSIIYLELNVAVIPQLSYNSEIQAYRDIPVQLLVEATPPAKVIEWYNHEGLSCADCPNPVTLIEKPTVYGFTVWDENGCSASGQILVELNEGPVEVYIPNIFSPNGDGINDVFNIYGENINSIEFLRVYDRFGSLVYSESGGTQGPGSGWDGTMNGRALNPGVYVYYIGYITADNNMHQKSGDITLFR